jgi:hypothetical protein
MFKSKLIPVLRPSYTQAAPEGGNAGGGGNSSGNVLPPGVAQGSAAASALQGQQAPAQGGNGGQQTGDQKPAGYVPVAEVAQERQKRHELEQKVAEMQTAQTNQLEAFKAALGLKPEQTADQVAATLQKQQNDHRTALVQLSVHQLATTAGADPAKLLDSNSFLNSIKDLQPTDHAGIRAAITKAVETNQTLAATPVTRPGAGARDAANNGSKDNAAPTMSDLFRAARS